MKDYEPFKIILDALIKQGYSEDNAATILVDLIEEQKQLDEISSSIHRIIREEIRNPKRWS